MPLCWCVLDDLCRLGFFLFVFTISVYVTECSLLISNLAIKVVNAFWCLTSQFRISSAVSLPFHLVVLDLLRFFFLLTCGCI